MPLTLLALRLFHAYGVIEMGMRGAGQIEYLTKIAEPDVAVVVNAGSAHIELLGSTDAIAAAKAELLADLRPGATAVLPAGEPLLAAHLREDLHTVTFGPGGDVAEIPDALELPFTSGAHALQRPRRARRRPGGRRGAARAPGRGAQRAARTAHRAARAGCSSSTTATTPTRCRCAPPSTISPRAAPARRVAVLGDMLELGPTRRASTRRSARMPAAAASTCS